MKTILFLFMAGTMFSAWGQKVSSEKLPSAVKQSFAKLFPNVKEAKWEEEKKGQYEANFKSDGKEMSATFFGNGDLLETETEIKTSDLPKSALDYASQHYKCAKIKE